MPVPAHLRHLYRGPRWRELQEQVRQRASDRCESCGLPNKAQGWRLGKPGDVERPFVTVEAFEAGDVTEGQARAIIALKLQRSRAGKPEHQTAHHQVAHVDGNPHLNLLWNLKLWCSRCHTLHDRRQHRINVQATRARRRAGGTINFLAELGRPDLAGPVHYPTGPVTPPGGAACSP
jgi:hypothetical protein